MLFYSLDKKRYHVYNTRKAERKLDLASFFLNTFLVFSYVIVYFIII